MKRLFTNFIQWLKTGIEYALFMLLATLLFMIMLYGMVLLAWIIGRTL